MTSKFLSDSPLSSIDLQRNKHLVKWTARHNNVSHKGVKLNITTKECCESWLHIIQGVFFNWSALKMTKCQNLTVRLHVNPFKKVLSVRIS